MLTPKRVFTTVATVCTYAVLADEGWSKAIRETSKGVRGHHAPGPLLSHVLILKHAKEKVEWCGHNIDQQLQDH